jgi:hypothetical protein
MTTYPDKIGLSTLEAGWLLQKTEGQVHGMLRRRELHCVVEGRLIDPDDVDSFIESEFDRMLMRRLLAGVLVAPRPEKRWGENRRLCGLRSTP